MPSETKTTRSATSRNAVLLYLGFVLLTSFFTYFFRYNHPQAVFWDEPYHIAAAQKYLSGVYFMEQHPPLGKQLIALGEAITNSNPTDDAFVGTDYAKDFDPSFSFTGYRLFPSLLAWLIAPLLYFIFYFFTKNPALSALLSFVYIFDNAQIVHSRGAMVDSPLAFFGVLQILLFLHLQSGKIRSIGVFALLSFLFGVAFSLAISTKVVGLIFVLLIPAILFRLFPDARKIAIFLLLSLAGFLVAFVAVWQTHFALGDRIVDTNHDQGYYQASEEYKAILAVGTNGSLRNFPVMIRDSLQYIFFYNQGVPRLDLCKPDENGSPSSFWPFGARTINYRWEKVNDETFRYLYLQSNPIAWMSGLLGIVLCSFFLLSRILLPTKEKLRNGFVMLVVFGMYAGYMIAISVLPRVMYLYHYFVPLLFSYVLFGLAVDNLRTVGSYRLTDARKIVVATFLGLFIFAAFQFYRPLTYYEPISNNAFRYRSLIPLWELSCVDCEKFSPLAVPRTSEN